MHMRLLALDFDGVICDSAPENAATAWHCCQRLWPDEFPAGEVPPAQVVRFCSVARPYMETGYQAILMTRLMRQGAPEAVYGVDFPAHVKEHIAASGLTLEELKRCFGGERDRWTRDDLSSWLAFNRLYRGAPEALQALRQNPDVRTIILTTKEDRFVKRILDNFGVPFAQEDIYGLERIRKKDIELADFLASGAYERIAFVEDRLLTLLHCAEVPALKEIDLCFAPWGYTTAEQRAEAKSNPRISVLPDISALAGLCG